jgi:DNA-binding IclR family transcriptional regulator
MPKRKRLPALTPRPRQILDFVLNSVALGTHDNEGEIGAIAKQLGMTEKRLRTTVEKMEEQGYVTLKNDFVYPTVAAILHQNPSMSENEAKAVLRRLR